jgi:hypothetical protein
MSLSQKYSDTLQNLKASGLLVQVFGRIGFDYITTKKGLKVIYISNELAKKHGFWTEGTFRDSVWICVAPSPEAFLESYKIASCKPSKLIDRKFLEIALNII